MGVLALCMVDSRIFSELPHFDHLFLQQGLDFSDVLPLYANLTLFYRTNFLFYINESPLGLSCFLFDTKTHLWEYCRHNSAYLFLWCQICSVVLGKRSFEGLREQYAEEIFGPKRGQVMGSWRKLYSASLSIFYKIKGSGASGIIRFARIRKRET
jgi:hypothetical protein